MPILTKREIRMFNGQLSSSEYHHREKEDSLEKLERFQYKMQNHDYVRRRNELIPRAEAYATRNQTPRSKFTNFTRLFLQEMDRLAREAGI